MRSTAVLPLSLVVMALLGTVQSLPTTMSGVSDARTPHKRAAASQVYDTHQDASSVSLGSMRVNVVHPPEGIVVKREDDDDDDDDEDDDDDDDDEDDDEDDDNDADDSSDDTDNKDDDPNGDPNDDDDNGPTPPPVLTPNSNGLGLFGIIKRSNPAHRLALRHRSRSGGEDGIHGDDDDDDDEHSSHHGQHRDGGRHGDDDGGRYGDDDDDDD